MNADRAKSGAIGAGRLAIRGYGQLTARWRPDPDFLIIGAKRGGTTSLYFDLLEHAQVCPLFPRPDHLPKAAATKGIHYFDSNYFHRRVWYQSHLPSAAVRRRQESRIGARVVTGEASPYYQFHPAGADRVAANLPEVKLVSLLRDPVMRTFSHWKERRRNGLEQLSFADALAAEDDRIGDVEERLRTDPTFHSYAHEQQSYARQSEYAGALANWYALFPSAQILVLASEDYYRDPQTVLDRIADFLGLEKRPSATMQVRNATAGGDLDATTRAKLASRFAPDVERLQQLTGETFPWS